MATSDISFERSLYVACALNGTPEEYRQEVEDIKGELQNTHGVNVLRFLGLGSHSALEVYEWDMNLVENCSAFLGIYGRLSDGRGMETQQALRRGIPMLGVALEDDVVSKMIEGGFEKYGQPFRRVFNLRQEVPALAIRQFVEVHGVL